MELVTEDPLNRLFVKGDEVNRELLGNLLLKYVRLDEKGNIFPLTPFFDQTNKNKIIILLLARKALFLKTGAEESLTPIEIGKLVSMPGGSVRPTLRTLVDAKLADVEDEKYKIFSYAIPRCAELVEVKPLSENALENRTRSKPEPSKISMRAAIEDVIRQGGLDEGKTVGEILNLVLQRRSGTTYGSLYKIILDLTNDQKLAREIIGDTWHYRRAK